MMEHVEPMGVDPRDVTRVLPPYSLGGDEIKRLHHHAVAIARALGIVGLLHVEFALKHDAVYVLGVSRGASATLPFVSRAIGVPLARLAAGVRLGEPVPEIEPRPPGLVAVSHAAGSSREVMAVDDDVRTAHLKCQLAAGVRLPTAGRAWLSARSCDRRALVMLAQRLSRLGFTVLAAGDTARVLRRHGLAVEDSGDRRLIDLVRAGAIALAVDVPGDDDARRRSAEARHEALRRHLPYAGSLDGAQTLVGALEILLEEDRQPIALRNVFRLGSPPAAA